MTTQDDSPVTLGEWLIIVGIALLMVGLLLFPWRIWFPDRGRCLRSHLEQHHRDGYMSVSSDADGQMSLHWNDAEDWKTIECDEWEFPRGRMEQEDPRRE